MENAFAAVGPASYAQSKRPAHEEAEEMNIGLISVIALAAAKFLALAAVGVLAYLLSRIHQLRERKRLETARPTPADTGNSVPKAAPGPAAIEMGHPIGVRRAAAPAANPSPAGPMPLDDVAGRLLIAYPGQVDVALKFLGWVGILGAAMVSVITVVLGMLPGALRIWAAATPDFRVEEGSVLGSDEILEPNNMLDSPYPGAGKPLVSKYLRPPRDGYWLNR